MPGQHSKEPASRSIAAGKASAGRSSASGKPASKGIVASKPATGKHSRPSKPDSGKRFRRTAIIFSILATSLMAFEAWLRVSIAAQSVSARLVILAMGLVAAGIAVCMLREDRAGLFALLVLEIGAGIICGIAGCLYMPAVAISGAGIALGIQLALASVPEKSSPQGKLLTRGQLHIVLGGTCIALGIAALLVDMLGIAGIRQMPACLDGAWRILESFLFAAGILLIALKNSENCGRAACCVLIAGAIAASAVAFGVGTTTQDVGLVNIYLAASFALACGLGEFALDR